MRDSFSNYNLWKLRFDIAEIFEMCMDKIIHHINKNFGTNKVCFLSLLLESMDKHRTELLWDPNHIGASMVNY